MQLNRITAIAAAIIIAGFTHSLAAQEKLDINQAENAAPPVVPEQDLVFESTLEETNLPVQVIVQTEDKFLSEMKVYPSF